MNQILYIPLNRTKKFLFKFQFFVSIFVIIGLILYTSFHILSLSKQEKLSKQLTDNYSVSKLYSNNSESGITTIESNLFGIIEIPKINVYYPVFSHLDEELLKIAPCKFNGNSPKENGNICIAGHNYNNNLFFSNLSNLEAGDEIFLYDNDGKKYIYNVFSIYEVNSTDLSPVLENSQNKKILTLITCNNLNDKRIVVKAK